jgi:hypothetical protein
MTIGIGTPALARPPAADTEVVRQPTSMHQLELKTPYWTRNDPQWWLVDATVQSCMGEIGDTGINNYCILAQKDRNSFVQTCYAPEAGHAWRLEWRVTGDDGSYVHYYAQLPDFASDCIPHIGKVVNAFRAFYRGYGLPDWLAWIPLDI